MGNDRETSGKGREGRRWVPNKDRTVRSKKSFDKKKVEHLVSDEKPVYRGELDPRQKDPERKPRSIPFSEQRVMDKAARLGENVIFAIGNAPTALIRLRELIDGGYRPKLIIGVPVGFVNVVVSKELIMETDVPCIVARGRKGGSNVAACIVNALLYVLDEKRGE